MVFIASSLSISRMRLFGWFIGQPGCPKVTLKWQDPPIWLGHLAYIDHFVPWHVLSIIIWLQFTVDQFRKIPTSIRDLTQGSRTPVNRQKSIVASCITRDGPWHVAGASCQMIRRNNYCLNRSDTHCAVGCSTRGYWWAQPSLTSSFGGSETFRWNCTPFENNYPCASGLCGCYGDPSMHTCKRKVENQLPAVQVLD